MEALDPPDCADDLRSDPVSPPVPPSITNDKSANMLEDKVVHPAKRMWNSDADEPVETTKRARLAESFDNRHNDNATHDKPVHVNAVAPVQNLDKDTNGDGSGDHLPQDTSNGALDNTSSLVNNSKGASLPETVDESAKETNAAPVETSTADANTVAETSASAKETSASAKETSASAKETSASAKETSASAKETSASAKETSASAKETSVQSDNEEESMDVDSNSGVSSAPVTPVTPKPSGLETSRTETTENSTSNLRYSPSGTPSGAESKELTKDGVDSDSNSSTGVLRKQGVSSPAISTAAALPSEQDADTDVCGEQASRTDGESGTSQKLDIENGDEKSLTSPTGTVAYLKDMIKERFKDQVEKYNSDSKTTTGKEDHQICSAKEDSKSEINKVSSKSSSPEDDIIVLSDDDVEVENAPEDDASSIDTGPFSPLPDDSPLSKLTDSELDQRDKAIRDLQEELRTEEGKLLLLKKLRQSQLQPVQVVPKEGAAATAATTTPSVSSVAPAPPKVNPTPTVTTSLPQLLRNSQGMKVQLSVHQQHQLKQLQQLQQQQKSSGRIIQMPQLVRGTQIQTVGRNLLTSQSGPPPLVMVSRGSMQGSMHNARHIIRVSGTGAVSTTAIQTVGSHASSLQSRTSTSTANDSQSAASRQAAAKLALRKQLEKTLLQIPPPKPPPPELHFLPSAANNEFIILVGLEEVVNTILEAEKDAKKKTQQRFTDPFRCAQCKTDFTTIWKQDAKQGIMCETCIVSNQKKSLKAEHTNRLKTAFVKALQQEQEIEQRMQQGQSPIIHSTQPMARQLHQISQIPSSQQSRHRVMNPVPHQQRTVLNPAPNTQRVMQPVTYTYIPHVSSVKNSSQSFAYRVPTTQIQMVTKNQLASSHHSAAARQREYLLDMIPSKVLSQNAAVPWKR